MSAINYRLEDGTYGNVRVRKTDRLLNIRVADTRLISFDPLTSVAKIEAGIPSVAKARALTKFFKLVDCDRFSASLYQHNIHIFDRKTNTEIVLGRGESCNKQLPTRASIVVLADPKVFNNYSLRVMLNARARDIAATAGMPPDVATNRQTHHFEL